MPNIPVKSTPGGTLMRLSRLVSGTDAVQGVDAASTPKIYYTPRVLIDLNTAPGTVKTLSGLIPTNARFATARLIGTDDADSANFSWGEDPTTAQGGGEAIYHKEEIDILAPTQFRIIRTSAVDTTAGKLVMCVHFWDYVI